MEFIRGLVRPFIAFAFTAICGYLVYTEEAGVKEVFTVMGIVIAFYFQERGMLKAIKETKAGNEKID